MIPSLLASEIRTSIAEFLTTEFRPTTPGLENLMEKFLAKEDNIFKGPLLSIGLPFRQGTIGKDYFPDVSMVYPPYRHQELAFNRLQSPNYQSTLIATGTGSGKTECFMIPILDYCYQNRQQKGVKAILIYPMNALATDQSKRLAKLIWDNPNLKGNITAGLFVGASEREPKRLMGKDHLITDKNLIRRNPPDILLTNYKMLDYLLIRPKDQAIWSHNIPTTLRYLVVDEIHTFDGAQGSDLACLIRRLKARLNTPPQHLVCVGTSATLGTGHSSHDSSHDSSQGMLDYANTVFNEPFDQSALITEDRLTYNEFFADAFINPQPLPSSSQLEALTPSNYASIEAYIKAQYELWFNIPLTANFEDMDWRIELGEKLKSLPIIYNIFKIVNTQQVISLQELWEQLSKKMNLPHTPHPTPHTPYLDSLLALCALARNQDKKPWINLRLQFWLRELRRMVATVSTSPDLLYGDDLLPEEKNKTLPIIHCRSCGSTGWGGLRKQTGDKHIGSELQSFYQAFFSSNPLTTFVFPSSDTPPSGWLSHHLCGDCLTLNKSFNNKVSHCVRCGSDNLIRVIEPENLVKIKENKGEISREIQHHCPFCGNKNGLLILGSQAATLASAAIGTLYASTYNDDRKLITFSDSVQDAAHRAGFFEARTYRTTFRSAIVQYLNSHNNQTLHHICQDFAKYWRSQLGTDADYTSTFMPSDLQWLREWEDLQLHDKVSPNLVSLINQRLEWEIMSEIGLYATRGGSLERTQSCGVQVEAKLLQRAIAQLKPILENEIGGLENISEHTLKQFILGLIHHLRHRGGILHPVTEGYIATANTYLLQNPLFMPGFGPTSLKPIYLSSRSLAHTETLLKSGKTATWYETWAYKLFSDYSTLIIPQLDNLYKLTLNSLLEQSILGVRSSIHNAKVWGIEPTALTMNKENHSLKCNHCGHTITCVSEELSSWEQMPCLRPQCIGSYDKKQSGDSNFYHHLYGKGNLWRIFAREHTGLLAREIRETLENNFIEGKKRSAPNLLSATSTLEMGIDIGDLSSALLCSIPPAQANYKQRIGRAGRRDGNALVVAIANGTPHDLFFWADPLKMIGGEVDTPGTYLNTSAILQRQLTAYCLDQWVGEGITVKQLPETLGTVLNAVQQQNLSRFPYTWLEYIEQNQQKLLQGFLRLFEEQIATKTQEELQVFIEKGQNNQGGLTWCILNRIEEKVTDRQNLKRQIDTLRRRMKQEETGARALNYQEKIAELNSERRSLMELVQAIDKKNTFNFFTDEGLLPNYAFPEPGVILRSVVWRKKDNQEFNQKNDYETTIFEYERPSAIAIGEIVPGGSFYAEGKRVNIDQIDLNLSSIEEWRLCRNCSYACPTSLPAAKTATCPRCQDVMWSDEGRKKKMVRLRQVMANSNAKDSRIGDDRDQRQPNFFTRQMLVDFDPTCWENSQVIEDETFPFGFEFLPRVNFRDINFGQASSLAETVEIAGESRPRAGFSICRFCGKVQKGRGKQDHAFSCRIRYDKKPKNYLENVYLFREFESEAIRFLMPVDTLTSQEKLHSFVAALQLGLKLYFQGNIDHLKTLISQEPSGSSLLRKPFLFLYDTVPGGTGCLRQLTRDSNQLFILLEKALKVIRACKCEDGCYQCLYAYRNSFDQDLTSRRIARDLLNEIISRKDKLRANSQGLAEIPLNALFDSVLEQRFIEAISAYRYQDKPTIMRPEMVRGKTGYFITIGKQSWNIEPQVELGKNQGVAVTSRADFVFYPSKNSSEILPIAVFTDGWQHHANRLETDFSQRMAIVKSGKYHVWSLSWSDVESQLSKQTTNDYWANLLEKEINTSFQKNRNPVYKQYNCLEFLPLINANSFVWLMNFLANPEQRQWSKFALVTSLAHIDPILSKNPQQRETWLVDLKKFMNADIWDDFAHNHPPQYFGKVEWLSTQEVPLCEIYTAIAPKEHQRGNTESTLVAMRFNEQIAATEEERQTIWNGILRQFNLNQFLPYSYISTSQEYNDTVIFPTPKKKTTETETEKKWEEIEELVFEEEAIELLKYMKENHWIIPEAGYELTNEKGKVIAEAEFAWIDNKAAIITNESNPETWKSLGWNIEIITEILPQPQNFATTHNLL